MKGSKFIQIAVTGPDQEGDHCVYALDADGVVWALDGDEWERVPGRGEAVTEIDS
jgi:hypothetical protein